MQTKTNERKVRMKKQILTMTLVGLTGSLLAAEAGAKDEVVNAAKKLGEKANYSWKTTVVVPEGAPFKPGPTEGKTEKDGFTHAKLSFRDNTSEIVKKGEKVAFTNQDGDWQTPADAENDQGPGRFMAAIAQNLKVPAAQAAEVAE